MAAVIECNGPSWEDHVVLTVRCRSGGLSGGSTELPGCPGQIEFGFGQVHSEAYPRPNGQVKHLQQTNGQVNLMVGQVKHYVYLRVGTSPYW